ncbi:GspH/FimT family protein [Alteromonas sp. ASW11-36]|uniref:Type II secretion system protein H n=1 Tax=Alteromonas arenosi TaxID=3055817 RepID=A0ABT7SX98_9ALTE|nr:GspH/FimT family protein [Alteromonas sp. ASW11-36]MDM7860813.1 GspH/FimT family protein [Alteromonas sp. ASW11-36]
MYNSKGLTLLELVLVVAIIALVVTLGAPSIINAQRVMAHKGAVESSYFILQSARSQAISINNDVTVQFNAAAPWCIGVSDAGNCDCAVANSCVVNGVERVLSGEDFNNIVLQEINFGGNAFTIYDGQRGMAVNNSGSFVLSDGAAEARLTLSEIGRLTVCMEAGDLGAYPAC